jgi:hypothetical protein
MFRKKSSGTIGRYRDYSTSAPYSPVRTPYHKRSISLFSVLSAISGIAVCALIIFLVRSCSCDTRSQENPAKRTESRTNSAQVEAEINTPAQKRNAHFRQNTSTTAPVNTASDAKAANEEPAEPFVPKTIDMGTHVEIITSPKK